MGALTLGLSRNILNLAEIEIHFQLVSPHLDD